MLVSVIIPVYDAGPYVREAVESAVAQPETGEVLLIEDGSRDKSLQVCQQLAKQYPRVRLLRHPDGANHGAGASRNLGIRSARFDYVAFLDADDFFLPGRFVLAVPLLNQDPELEGVYEAVGIEFESQEEKDRWLSLRGHDALTTMSDCVAPDELFEKQSPVGRLGFCQTNGWVLRKSVFMKTGLFPDIRLHQDSVMFVKLAAVGKMMPGRLREPVAIRRVHATNRSSVPRPPARVYWDRIRMWATLWRWGKNELSQSRQNLLLERFLEYASAPYRKAGSPIGRRLLTSVQLTGVGLFYPDLIFEREFRLRYRRAILPYCARKMFVSIKASLRRAQ
jgi:hypothetical protein